MKLLLLFFLTLGIVFIVIVLLQPPKFEQSFELELAEDIQLMDLAGTRCDLKRIHLSEVNTLDISNLQTGLYFVIVRTLDGILSQPLTITR